MGLEVGVGVSEWSDSPWLADEDFMALMDYAALASDDEIIKVINGSEDDFLKTEEAKNYRRIRQGNNFTEETFAGIREKFPSTRLMDGGGIESLLRLYALREARAQEIPADIIPNAIVIINERTMRTPRYHIGNLPIFGGFFFDEKTVYDTAIYLPAI